MLTETELQFDRKTILKNDEAQKPTNVWKQVFLKVITDLRIQQKVMD